MPTNLCHDSLCATSLGCFVTPSLFGDGPREVSSPSLFAEPTAQFLARASGEFWDAVRGLVSDWVGRFPASERADLTGRLLSPEDHHHRAAFLELYLHESLIRAGFGVEIHPVLANSDRQPDFLVHGSDEPFYLEARATALASKKVGSNRRIGEFYDALNKMDSPNFWLWVDVTSEGGTALSVRKLRGPLTRWLEGLDPDVESIYEEMPLFRWQRDGWDIEIRAEPKSPSSRGPGSTERPIAVYGSEQSWTDVEPLKRALEDKGSAYGALGHGFVVAVGTNLYADGNLNSLLYGSRDFTVVPTASETVETRRSDGYFTRPGAEKSHPHVSGLLVVNNLAPWWVADRRPTYWKNPAPDHDVAPSPAWDVMALNDGLVEQSSATVDPRSLFGLPDPWPPGPAFPEEDG
ncbi:hypothetical protein [Cellulosimicrobium sp. RS]|uniref:hypothetical protein n=1 Tax=Cellulosimicrobium sp. RS TaxID=3381347 RepID=UPI0038FC2D7D